MASPTICYDVFLSHNSLERDAATDLANRLAQEGLRVFLDEKVLVAGDSLPTEIPTALAASLSCAVLLGPSGLGAWQKLETEIALRQRVDNPAYRIISLTLAKANPADLPIGLRHLVRIDFSSGIDDPKAFRKLLDGIRGSSSPEWNTADPAHPLPYRSMAPAAEGFVLRSELGTVVNALTSEPDDPAAQGPVTVALTTALRGAGGFGKTALAQAVCEDETVRMRFPAGILWITLGQGLGQADRLARVRDLLRWWTRREPPAYETLEVAAATLREALSGQRILLVLDDVWLAADVEPFAQVPPPAALFLTTRNTRALPFAARTVVVDALEVPQAVELLKHGLAPLPPTSTLERLVRRLGEWPILLRLVNAQLRQEYRDGVPAEKAFQIVERALDEAGLTAFDRGDEIARNLAVRRTVEASLQRLPPEDRQRYGQLAVFVEDQQIPMPVLELLWGVGESEAHRLCRLLGEMSLLYRFDPVNRWAQLHDVIRAYLLREHRESIQSFHSSLVDSHWERLKSGGAPRETELYFLSRLPYHMKESGRESDLEDLLFSYPWLQKKVAEAGVNAAMADYQLLPGSNDAESVRQALRLARSVLTEDVSQLGGQLHGRLAGSPSPRLAELLAGAVAAQHRPWLRPLAATFQKPDGPLVNSFNAHQGEIRAVVQLDENRFATAATDGKIHVWNFASGELCATLYVDGNPIRHLAAVCANRLLAGSDDGVIRLWDLDEQHVVEHFETHASPVTALRLRREEFISGSEDGTLLHWKLASNRPLRSLKGHSSRINGLGFLDSRRIVSIGEDQTLRVWNLVSGRQLRSFSLFPFRADVLEVTASNEVILGTFAGEIQVWKPLSSESKPRRSLRHHATWIDAMCMLGRDLGVSTVGGLATIQLWSSRSAHALGPEIQVPGSGVTSLARFNAGHLLCGSKEGILSVWAVDGLMERVNSKPPASVYSLAVVDATTVVSVRDRSLHIWNVPDARPSRTLEGHSDTVNSVCALSLERVASSSSDSTIRIWSLRTGELLHTIQCSEKPNALAALTADWLASGSLGALKALPIQIWDVRSGQEVFHLPAFPGVSALCATDNRYLLVGTYDGLVLHLDISVGTNHRTFALRGHEKGVFSLAALDQNHIASGSLDKTIRIWDLTTQETLRVLRGHESEVMGLAALSSNLLASASADQTVKVWHVETGALLTNLHFDIGLSSIAVMPDGRTLVAGDAAGGVHFLRLESLTG
ncbi:MAG: TIR domain-containing protein [Acidobacteriota bacterium]|nr:TIR domain-containing protein [Acidobacteriota bacterium]